MDRSLYPIREYFCRYDSQEDIDANADVHITEGGNIQSTAYHYRKNGKNVYDPEEKEKFYSDVKPDEVRKFIGECGVFIESKYTESSTKKFTFPRNDLGSEASSSQEE